MELYCAGIAHNDPHGRSNVAQWLKSHVARLRCDPSFVAVECDPALVNIVLEQRQLFVALAHKEWPLIELFDLENLAKIIIYEMDAHADTVPLVQTHFIDEKRPPRIVNAARRKAEMTIATLQASIGNGQAPKSLNDFYDALATKRSEDTRQLKEFMTDMVDAGPDVDPIPDISNAEEDRDRKFHRLLTEKMSLASGAWGALVIGADHLENHPGTLCALLETDGIRCHVSDLTPEGAHFEG